MVMGLFVAAAVGVGIAIQATVLADASRDIGALALSLALLISGALVGSVWATMAGRWPSVAEAVTFAWWVPLGAVGWGLVAAIAFAAARIGSAATLSVSVAAQTTAALLLSTPLTAVGLKPVVGVVLMVAGAVLVATST